MRLTCPSCLAEFSLDVAIGRDEDARAVAELLQRHLTLGGPLVRYLTLFRPAKRRLQMARMVALVRELQPDIDRGAITRKGRDWPAPLPMWQAAFDLVQAARDKGTLTLPLTSHGYLYEVLCALSDKAEGQSERDREAAARQRGSDAAATPVQAAAAAAGPVAAPAPPPYDMSKGPSRAARELRARMAAAQLARSTEPATDASSHTVTDAGADRT